jgi:hypothetical protein
MAVVPYVGVTWVDGAGGGTPTSAANFNIMNAGINDISYAPAVRAWAGAATSCTNNVYTTQALNSEDFDQAGNAASTMHDTVTNNSRLTCRFAGVYQIVGHGSFALSAAGTYRELRVFLNNATVVGVGETAGPSAAAQDMSVVTLYKLAVNDFVELQALQNSGGALNFTTSGFMMVRVA